VETWESGLLVTVGDEVGEVRSWVPVEVGDEGDEDNVEPEEPETDDGEESEDGREVDEGRGAEEDRDEESPEGVSTNDVGETADDDAPWALLD